LHQEHGRNNRHAWNLKNQHHLHNVKHLRTLTVFHWAIVLGISSKHSEKGSFPFLSFGTVTHEQFMCGERTSWKVNRSVTAHSNELTWLTEIQKDQTQCVHGNVLVFHLVCLSFNFRKSIQYFLTSIFWNSKIN
jgi:hypothetical protein